MSYQNIDINECAEGRYRCDEHCHNTIGSYSCNCTGPGYRLHSDGYTCESKCGLLRKTNLTLTITLCKIFFM